MGGFGSAPQCYPQDGKPESREKVEAPDLGPHNTKSYSIRTPFKRDLLPGSSRLGAVDSKPYAGSFGPGKPREDSGFRDWGLGFRVEGLGLRVWGLGLRVWGLGNWAR